MAIFQVISGFFPILFFIGIFWLVSYLGKQGFKEILDKYMSAESLPAGGIRLVELRYKGFKLRNSAKLAEDASRLWIKAMGIPALAIPYHDILRIEKYNNAYLLKLKGDLNGPSFYLSPSDVEKFPHLKAKISAPEKTATTSSQLLKSTLEVAPRPTSFDTNLPQLKSSASNSIRNLIFFLLTAGVAYYVIRYWAF